MVGTDGGDYTFLNVTNSGAACSVKGFPTVRIYDSHNHLAGGPAPRRAGSTAQKLVLQHGDQAQFEIYDVSSSAPACQGDTQGYLKTVLPGQNVPVTTSGYGYSACQLSVTALHAPTSQQPTS